MAPTREIAPAVAKKVNGVDQTCWVRVSTFDKLAEVCDKFLSKGKKVFVRGNIVFDPTTGSPKIWAKKDGTAGCSFEVTANTVEFLSAAGDRQPLEQGAVGQSVAEEEIPF